MVTPENEFIDWLIEGVKEKPASMEFINNAKKDEN